MEGMINARRATESGTNGENLLELPNLLESIILRILSKLPVKSLLRFRCVSKPWLSIISSRAFAKLHLEQSSLHPSSNIHKILSQADKTNHDFTTFDIHGYKSRVPTFPLGFTKILGSCNGFVCVANPECSKILLWNPCTGVHKELPNPKLRNTGCMNVIRTGFGYDKSIDDFKVFLATGKHNMKFSNVGVFSLRSGSWSWYEDTKNYLHHCLPWKDCGADQSSVFLNGAIHWLDCCRNKNGPVIVALNLTTISFKEMALPSVDLKLCECVVGVVGGLLCCVIINDELDENVLWVMEDYGVKESWTEILKIPAHGYTGFGKCQPLWLGKSGEIVYYNDGMDIITYDPKTKTRKGVFCGFGTAIVYLESLLSPNHFTEIWDKHKRRTNNPKRPRIQ